MPFGGTNLDDQLQISFASSVMKGSTSKWWYMQIQGHPESAGTAISTYSTVELHQKSSGAWRFSAGWLAFAGAIDSLPEKARYHSDPSPSRSSRERRVSTHKILQSNDAYKTRFGRVSMRRQQLAALCGLVVAVVVPLPPSGGTHWQPLH